MAGKITRIMYIELKTGHQDDGPACIGRVTFSRTGRTIYYKDKVFSRAKGIEGNYMLDTSDPHRKGPDPQVRGSHAAEYWISGPKKDGNDRLFGNVPVDVDADVAEEYWTTIRGRTKQDMP